MTLPFTATLSSQPGQTDDAPAWSAGLAELLASLHQRDGGDPAQAGRIRDWVRKLAAGLAQGHVCLVDEHAPWRNLSSPVLVDAARAADTVAPLVAEDERLYLYRHWQAETQLAQALSALDEAVGDAAPVAAHHLDGLNERQRQAVAMATQRRFSLITGGPGTGKTYTLVRILLALLEQNPTLHVALAAPTGKAAARMYEALSAALAKATGVTDAMRAALPTSASTLHRLLGIQYDRPAQYHAANPLPFDLVIVDEASMIDLRLASQLLAAIDPRRTRLILLGDANQLAAVEAGAVLEEMGRAPRLQAARVALNESQRFGADSGIGRLAAAICAGDSAAVLGFRRQGLDKVRFEDLPGAEALAEALFRGYAPYVDALRGGADTEAVLAAFGRFRVLCALREGTTGVAGLNERLTARLRAALGQEAGAALWFHGRPVMVMQNDYALNVFNGDIGVALRSAAGLEVFFPGRERGISVARLAHVETAFAMTVHKSQGSEFEEVAVVLPGADSQVVSRELLYTGVTRARVRVQVWAGERGLSVAVGRRTERRSGLGGKVIM
ncbi:DNA helicase/exodeoxyribonuclease V alpha subunit [Fluviicoccus keumensis]|uniref:RecBCD enzyme subunit RecD n=1 Tax=Fluviicoccus keumensis TaxID=1435465 RepID=A0A4Q7YLK8_9GAMM|nr:exodeoxyribonuclease V subunit alpha [Fluviicoccus keumensis]RZU38220.1 DNA helicase/exodeoxyribonuclease V alpha subunit [Fluviicoccus keumensis]